jgi:site-specific recombinase XerD
MARKNYPGSIDRRSDTFRIRLLVRGRRHTFTIDTTDQGEAERFAMARYLELSQAAAPGDLRGRKGLPRDVTVALLLDLYERNVLPELAPGTQDAYRDSFKAIRKYFVDTIGDPSIDSVDGAAVMQFLSWRATHRLKGATRLHNRTVAKDRAVLHRVFAYGVTAGLRAANPVTLVDPPKSDERDPVLLSSDEYERLLGACDDRPMLSLYITTLAEAGLRCESECLWLRFEDVNLAEGFLWVASGREGHRTKSGKGRWVPMTPRLTEAMRAHFARYRFATYGDTPTPWIFHHEVTRRRAQAGDRIGSLRSSFRSAVKRAKVPAAVWQHDLRHRRVTTWLAEEKNPVHVKEALGHSDLRTTMRYQHLSREHLRSLVNESARPARRGKRA